MSVSRYWAVLVWSLVIWSGAAWAADLPAQPGSVHRYELNAEPLLAFLRRFYQDQGQQVVFSDALRADKRTLNGVQQGQYAAIARSVLSSNELLAYHDGAQVYMYRHQDITQRFFTVDPQQVPALRRALAHDLPGDQHNRTRVQTVLGTVDASGIPRYLDQVQQLVNAVARRDEPEAFRYVALKYAWATDRSFTVGGQSVSVPGVATLLRELIGAPASARPQHPVASRRATSVRDPASARKGVTEQTAAFVQAADAQMVSDKPGGRIVADPARNAIMLRDTPARMRWYEELIQRLDVPTQIVEIEAAIIDVNTDRLQEVGVEWRLARDHWEVMSAQSGSKLGFLSALVQDSVVGMQQLPGFQVGAIIGDRHQFISRLNLLEQDGVLKVASRPKVVTLNDLEAVIESSRTLYVPVQGAYEVDLFEVIAGTILRVTPHVIHDGSQSRIRMTLAIEDGTVDMLQYGGPNGNDVPVATRHAVNTQAIINAGHSLLLGGLVRDEEVTSVQKVPLLGSLPVIGALFRSESTSVRKSERMFLLSPRLVTLSGEGSVSTAPLSDYSQASRQWLQHTCQGNCVEEYGSQGMQFY